MGTLLAAALLLLQDDEHLATTAPRVQSRWSTSVAFRTVLLDGDRAAVRPAVTGGAGTFTYDELWDTGFGGRVDAFYRASEDDDPVAWGGYFGFVGDTFNGSRASTGAFAFQTDDMNLLQAQVGMKVGSAPAGPDGDVFWELRGGIGAGYVHGLKATVSAVPGGARLAHAGFFTDSWGFTSEVMARVGYAQDDWSVFAGAGWGVMADPTEGSLGTNPEAMNFFPIEFGVSIGF